MTQNGRTGRARATMSWHSLVDHGPIDVGVAGRREVLRDRRFVQGDHRAAGSVQAAARAFAAAKQTAQGLVQEHIRLVEARRSPFAPDQARATEGIAAFRSRLLARPPWAKLPVTRLAVMASDDVSELPKMLPIATARAPPTPSPPLAPAPPEPPWARLRRKSVLLTVAVALFSRARPPPMPSPPEPPLAPALPIAVLTITVLLESATLPPLLRMPPPAARPPPLSPVALLLLIVLDATLNVPEL